MKINTLKSTLWMKAVILFSAVFLNFSLGQLNAQQVLLDSHSAGNGLTSWNITTSHANELIIISAGGYGVSGNALSTSPGTVTVNGNNATFLNDGQWLDFNFSWTASIWAYVAATPGTYTCSCTENGEISPFYFNFAASVYQPNCPIGLDLSNIVIGGVDSNHGPTTISASITTTEGGSWIYGTVDNNDNGATGVVAWNSQLTQLDFTYINDGIDGAQADSTYASAGTYTITSTDIGASNVWMTIALIAVQPNLSCCALSDSAKVVTNVKCNGGSDGSAIGTPYNGHAPYTYLWSPTGQTTATATGLTAGTYTVVISDTISCSATAIVTITQPPVLAASIIPTNIICNGGAGTEAATATGGTGPYQYLWAPGGNTNATGTGLSAGTYTMTITDANGCTSTASASITEPTALTVSLSGPSIICVGSSGNLTATVSGGSSPYVYTWIGQGIIPLGSTATVTPPATENDTIKITDANGCTASADITIQLGPNMAVTINGPASMCQGLTTTLCANINGGTGGNTYQWEPVNLTTPCISVSPSTTTSYTLTVIDNCGTTATTTSTLRINPLPATAFTTNLTQGCAPLCIQFYNTTTLAQGNAATYEWTFGNGDSSESQNPICCYPSSGKYTVALNVTSDSGCSSTLKKVNMLTAFAKPNAAFTYTPKFPTILNPTIQFTDLTTDTYGILYWSWTFGDGTDSVSNRENPMHTYQDTGSYCVNMIAMDEHGCVDTATTCFVLGPDFNLYIPSAFTPNGDNKDETFQPKGSYIKNFEMYIFDRWGALLYHTTDITKGWNGRVNGGSLAQEDVYVYKILVTDSQGTQHTYLGNVSLLK